MVFPPLRRLNPSLGPSFLSSKKGVVVYGHTGYLYVSAWLGHSAQILFWVSLEGHFLFCFVFACFLKILLAYS